MKRKLVMVLGSAALVIGASQTARADAFLSLTNGATVSCNNSTAAGVVACTAAGFVTVLGGNQIEFAGSVGGYSINDLKLLSNSPGGPAFSFVADNKAGVQNISAGASALTVSFAVNNFALPAGSPLTFSAAQNATFGVATAGSSQTFSGWANAANTLAVGVGTAVVTPTCTLGADAPPVSACSTVGVPVLFARAGLFAMNGTEVITLNQGGIAQFQGILGVTPPTTVPEPGTYALMATGLLALVGGRRVLRRKA